MSVSRSNQTSDATVASNSFWKHMDNEVGTIHSERCIGENGADQWSMYGMAGETSSKLQGAFVAAFSGLVRGCTQERTREFLLNIETEAKARGGKVYQNAMATLIVMTFQLRNCRGGKGEKQMSMWLFMELYTRFPKTIVALLPLFPKYGYWKDMSLFIAECHGVPQYKQLLEDIYTLMIKQLNEDLTALQNSKRNKGSKPKLSLLAKFIPKEGRALDKKCKTAKVLAEKLFPTQFTTDFKSAMRLYRQTISELNKAIDTTEVLMSEGRWDEVNFVLVASRCLNKHRRAFLNLKGGKKCKQEEPRSTEAKRIQCRENLLEHMEKAKKGEVKFKGKQMFIHEIINKMLTGTSIINLVEEEKTLLQLQWNTHREAIHQKLVELGIDADQVVPLCDVSGSMGGTPVEAAVALSIMISELAGPEYGNRFLSFSETPRWVEFKQEWSLWQKVKAAVESEWGMTTDFLAAHDLILDIAIKHKLKPEQVPKAMMVFSDMQFNSAASSCGTNNYPVLSKYSEERILNSIRQPRASSSWCYSSHTLKTQNFQTHHQILTNAYYNAGIKACGKPYTVPHMIYWNLRGDTVGFPVQADTPNTQMLSGFSAEMIPLVLENRISDYKEKPAPTPWDLFVKTMDDSQYDDVHQTIASTGEGIFHDYLPPIRETDEESEAKTQAKETNTEPIEVVGTKATLHTKKHYSSQQVADWLETLFTDYPDKDKVTKEILDNGVDGAVMAEIVADRDTGCLDEIGLNSNVKQKKVFTEWNKT